MDDKIKEIEKYCVEQMEELESYLYEQEDRPKDSLSCGMIDGEWNTYIEILKLIGSNSPYASRETYY